MTTHYVEWTHEGRPELCNFNGEATKPLEGPWLAEPDKVHWIDESTGMDCLAVRNHYGTWCGYVAVIEGHPLYGKGYPDEQVCELEVHGSITFADFCHESEKGPGFGVCHVPLEGRPEKVWWLGFDCGHAFDLMPGMHAWELTVMPDLAERKEDYATYRTLDYVKGECEGLAKQLASMS